MATFFFVPDEGRAVVSEITGEGGHVVGGVSEPEYMVTDEFTGSRISETPVVIVGLDDGELFDDEPVHRSALNFLPNEVVKRQAVEVGNKA